MNRFDLTPGQPDDPGARIIPLHRGIQVPRQQGGSDSPQSRPAFLDIEARLRDDRPVHIEIAGDRTTLERIGDALGSDRIVPLFLAFWSGSMFTLAMAILWERVL